MAAEVFPAIAQLPEPFRLALVAVDIVGLSYGEAARALGVGESTITTRLYRGRQRVARQLDPERVGAGKRTALMTRKKSAVGPASEPVLTT
jgi:RNA polymerase sigma-70 factor (ECF subfamily)